MFECEIPLINTMSQKYFIETHNAVPNLWLIKRLYCAFMVIILIPILWFNDLTFETLSDLCLLLTHFFHHGVWALRQARLVPCNMTMDSRLFCVTPSLLKILQCSYWTQMCQITAWLKLTFGLNRKASIFLTSVILQINACRYTVAASVKPR